MAARPHFIAPDGVDLQRLEQACAAGANDSITVTIIRLGHRPMEGAPRGDV